MAKIGRPSKIRKVATFSLEEKTMAKIEALAERWGVTKSEVINQAIEALDDDEISKLRLERAKLNAIRELI